MAEKFRPASIRSPTVEELGEIAAEYGFVCSPKDLQDYKEHIDESLRGYDVLDDLVAPTLPVKYPRTPGFKPQREENKLNAWYWRCDIRGAADGLLKGKTIGVKDNVCVAGVPMMNGTKIMEGYVPDIDATVVTKILDAGGRILGKTNCENLCLSGSSWTNDTGPTLNPHDQARSAGGSSSGSAVAVQVGDVDMAVGGDQAGSIRMPSSWCGIVGLKPTHGLVPYTGVMPIEITVDHVGPMARTVTDCALLLQAIAGYDGGLDPRQPRDLKVPDFSTLLEEPVSGKKIGLLIEGFNGCEDDVQKVVRQAAKKLSSAGVAVEDVSMPLHEKGLAIWGPICLEGAYKCMIKGNGAGYHYKGYYAEGLCSKLRDGYATKARNFSEPMTMATMMVTFIERHYGNLYYARAQNLNMMLTKAYDELLQKYDVLVMPTMPYKAPLLPGKDSTVKDRLKNALGMIKNTAPFDSTGHPALTINAGMSEGLPVGLMMVGRHFDDLTVLQLARALEKLQESVI